MNIVLLSGGSGKRLWPLSNDVRSKQFIKIFKTEDGYESMAQRVYRQIRSACQDISVTVATSKPQVSTIINQLGDKVDICVEPARRDTFPAITLACQYLKDVESVSGDETILVCPVDSYVEDDFFSSIIKAAEEEDSVPDKGILLLGVEPTYPSSKYGYIIPEGGKHESESVGNVCKGYSRAISYVEKPSEEDAALLIGKGALWSSGIFAFKLDYMLERAHELIDYKDYDDLYSRYGELRKISFDYAVIENETSLRVVRYKGPWTDLGTWNTMSDAMEAPVIGKAIMTAIWSAGLLISGFIGGIALTWVAIDSGDLDGRVFEKMEKRGYVRKNRYGTYAVNKKLVAGGFVEIHSLRFFFANFSVGIIEIKI
jgi:mannose-1-phosphate guanylyltransferase